jgi:hypothetical protein
MEADVFVDDVQQTNTRSGNTRYVLRDADGREYTTFRPGIGQDAEKFRGRRAHIAFHEEERNGFHNVYLDSIGPAPDEPQQPGEGTNPDEAAWSAAVEAAPWLVGSPEPEQPADPDELFDRLEPFKRRVAEDIREGTADGDESGEPG